MKLASAAFIALSLGLGLTGQAHAQSASAACATDYKAFWERFAAQGAKMEAKEVVEINRVALRGFDACTSGDQRFNAKDFFEKLGQGGSKPEDILKSIEGAGAKK